MKPTCGLTIERGPPEAVEPGRGFERGILATPVGWRFATGRRPGRRPVRSAALACGTLVACAAALISDASPPDDVGFSRIAIVRQGDDVSPLLTEIVASRIMDRCPATAEPGGADGFTLVLANDSSLGGEGFRIEDAGPGRVRISGDGGLGLAAGIGRFLRASRYGPDGFRPAAWRGTSYPAKPLRGMYFATHFHNYYHTAPTREVERYVEDLALWGFNTLTVWFDMHHFNGIEDPRARVMIERLRGLLAAAKRVGMRTGLAILGNEGYADSPRELRADVTGLYAYGVELCPSKPGALDRMLGWFDEEFAAFADLRPDFLSIGPYDQGGCVCEGCRPWGGNGFLKTSRAIVPVFRRHSPNGQVILVTWLFDYERHAHQGDWNGLARAVAADPPWYDFVLAGTHDGRLPDYLQRHPVPGGRPLIGFPEISMRGMFPWGGFGANPQPAHLQEQWQTWGPRVAGGFPYSEGIYEDLNKAIVSQFYWSGKPAEDTVREYVAYEYGPTAVDRVVEAVRLLEANQARTWKGGDFSPLPRTTLLLGEDHGAGQARKLLEDAEAGLTEKARSGWRWRVLMLRGLIDDALFKAGGELTSATDPLFAELTRLYHADNAAVFVRPPARATR